MSMAHRTSFPSPSTPNMLIEVNHNRSPEDPPWDRSRQHCSIYYCIIKHLDHGDNGHACAAISKDVVQTVIATHEGKHSPAFFDELRANLVVIKFAKHDNIEGDLKNEIKILSEELTETNPCYTQCCDFRYDGPELQWLALPFCNGGVLKDFAKRFPQALSFGFQWHVMCEVIRGMLYICFGISEPSQKAPREDWPLLTHGDIYSCNLLLSTRSPSFGNYPSVVLADFGRAETDYMSDDRSMSDGDSILSDEWMVDDWALMAHIESIADDALDVDDYLEDLNTDTRCIGHVLREIRAYLGDSEIRPDMATSHQRNWVALALAIQQFREHRTTSVAQEIMFLQARLRYAIDMREAAYKPMPADAVAFLNAAKVSDEELVASIY